MTLDFEIQLTSWRRGLKKKLAIRRYSCKMLGIGRDGHQMVDNDSAE